MQNASNNPSPAPAGAAAEPLSSQPEKGGSAAVKARAKRASKKTTTPISARIEDSILAKARDAAAGHEAGLTGVIEDALASHLATPGKAPAGKAPTPPAAIDPAQMAHLVKRIDGLESEMKSVKSELQKTSVNTGQVIDSMKAQMEIVMRLNMLMGKALGMDGDPLFKNVLTNLTKKGGTK